MKALVILLAIAFSIASLSTFSQQKWMPDRGAVGTVDFNNSKANVTPPPVTVTFNSYGYTENGSGTTADGVLVIGWADTLSEEFPIPDSVHGDFKWLSGFQNLDSVQIRVSITTKDDKFIDWGAWNTLTREDSMWKNFSWFLDTSGIGDKVKGWKMKVFLFVFQLYAPPGAYTGGSIQMKNLDAKGVTTGIEGGGLRPSGFKLEQNYPNPFNPSTIINFSLPAGEKVVLKVYDILGREVSTLMDQYMSAGSHLVNFDASNLPSGTYFYRITAGDFVKVKKMLLLK